MKIAYLIPLVLAQALAVASIGPAATPKHDSAPPNERRLVTISLRTHYISSASWTEITAKNTDDARALKVRIRYTTKMKGKDPESHFWSGRIEPHEVVTVTTAAISFATYQVTAEVLSATAEE